MAIIGLKQTGLKGLGWFLVLVGLSFGIFSCFQYFPLPGMQSGSNYGLAFAILFLTVTVTFLLVSIDFPKINIYKNGLFITFIVLDVLCLILLADGVFSAHAFVIFVGMVLAAIVLKLNITIIEEKKRLVCLISLAIEIGLVLIVSLMVDPANPKNGWFFVFLIYGILGMIGWDTLQSIFWKQKLRSLLCLGTTLVFGWVYGIHLVAESFPGTNLLGPIFMSIGVFLVLFIETQMRKKKLLVYVK